MNVNDVLRTTDMSDVRYIELVTGDSPRVSTSIAYYIADYVDIFNADTFDNRERLRAMRMFHDYLDATVKGMFRSRGDKGLIVSLV